MADFQLSAKAVITDVDVSKLQSALNQLKNIKTPVDISQMQGMAEQTKSLAAATAQAQKQTSALQKQYNQMRTAQKQLQQAKNNVDKLRDSTQRASGDTRTLAERMQEIGPRALAFRVATTLINAFVDSIQEAINFLRDLDQVMADIQKITGQTAAQLDRMGDQLIRIAGEFGLAASDVVEQFKTIIQAGFQAGQAMDVVRMASIGAAATTLDFAQATEILIQTFKVFGEQDAAGLFDQIAIAESNAAVTAKDIQDAMKRSAATFQAVNATVSDMIGLISALQETSRRGGAVVGTAFRTINTRLVAGDTRKEVEKLGVAVADATGNLRPLFDILNDISRAFNNLTEEERVQAATLIAGRRQFESFLQIINNVGRAQELAADSANAQGEALRRAAIQAETINGLLNKMSNAFLQVVKSANEFVPVTTIFKDLLKIMTSLLSVADGAAAKFAALAGSLILLKGLGKVLAPLAAGAFRGAAGTLGGGGLTAPVFGLGATRGVFGTGLGAPRNITRVGGAAAGGVAMGKAGEAATKATKAFGGLTTGLFGVTAAVSILAGLFSDAETDAGRFAKSISDLSTSFIGFAFGPVIGTLTTAIPVINSFTKAITTSVDRTSAFNMSLAIFGSETLAGLEAALVDAKAAADNETAAMLENAIAYEKASIVISRGGPQAARAVDAIGQEIQRLRNDAAGAEIPIKDVREAVVRGLKRAGFGEAVAQSIADNQRKFQELMSVTSIFTEDFSGLIVDSLEDLTQAANKEMMSLGSILRLSGAIFEESGFVKGQQIYIRALKEATLANEIFVKGITDVIEIRRLQAEQEIQFAEDAVSNQQMLFRTAIVNFQKELADMEGGADVDFSELEKVFENISGGGREVPKMNDALSALSNLLGDAGVQASDNLTKSTLELVDEFMDLEKSLLDNNNAARKYYETQRSIDFDELTSKLSDAEEARKREQGRILEMSDLLTGLDIDPTNMQQIQEVFEQLSIRAMGSTDAISSFLGIIRELENPISQARMELMYTIDQENRRVQALENDRRAIQDQISSLKDLEPSTERDNALKDKSNELAQKSADIEVAKGRAIGEAAKATRNLIQEQERAIDRAMEAQKQLITSLEELTIATEEAITQADVNAQEELKQAQQAVIESAENLSDAYRDLRDAQLSLGDAIADYRLGVMMADREIDMITGRIRGFSEQFRSIQNVFDEIISNTALTEQKRLELLQQSADQQLQLVQDVIDETISIGQKIFTMDAAGGAELVRGFAALRDVIAQFQAGGGFEGIDLNEFGNMLLSLPQSIRQEMVNALSSLPSTATLGGLSKQEIEKILFGAAVGESEEANIQNINDLTETQVELIGQIAELNQAGILAANAQLAEAQKQVELAEEQLAMDEIMLARAEENVQVVREEISSAAMLLNAAQHDVGELVSMSVDGSLQAVNKENIAKRAQEHIARLSTLQQISTNTESLSTNLSAFTSALGTLTGAATGHVPKNFASGNMREVAGLIKAYYAEKRAGPAGSRPVIANDSEWIIPTKDRGNIPNFQGGNANKIEVNAREMERLLTSILEELQSQTQEREGGAVSRAVPSDTMEPMQATININAQERVEVTGAATVADAVANSVRNALGDRLNEDQVAMISEQMMEIFNVLKNRGLMNSLGGGL